MPVKRSKIKKIRLVPMLIVMGIIFLLSHQPGDSLHIPSFIPGFDKVAHMIVYGVLAATILYAFEPAINNGRTLAPFLVTVTICILYGIGDEFHQSFIPGRFASAADLVADTLGVVVACAAWFFWKRKKNSTSQALFQ